VGFAVAAKALHRACFTITASQTIALRQSKKIKLGDAIIAATALVYGYTIVTRNVGGFKNIPSLMIIDPHTL